MLYEFCFFRTKLKNYYRRQQWIRKIHSLGNIAYDVSKSFSRKSELAQSQEFFKEYHARRYQKSLVKKLNSMVHEELKEKALKEKNKTDFNAFILMEKEQKLSKSKKRVQLVQNFLAKHMLSLKKMANLNLRAHELSMGAMTDRANRSNYRKFRAQAQLKRLEAEKQIEIYRQKALKLNI